MQYRNAQRREDGRITCEFFHPDSKQWEPITVSDGSGSYYEMAVFAVIQEELGDNVPLARAPSLDSRKQKALNAASVQHADLHRAIAENSTVERAISWVLKLQFASAWAVFDQTQNTALESFANIAQQGFALEGQLTGEDAEDLRDRTLQKGGAFFLANQIVEGASRLSEDSIGTASSAQELAQALDDLNAAEVVVRQQLDNLRAAAGEPPEE